MNEESDVSYELEDVDSPPNWDYEKLGFVDKSEFVLWCFFNRMGNPNYHGMEQVVYEVYE